MLVNAVFFTSCSSLWLKRGQTVDSVRSGINDPVASNATPNLVPKEQYDELARKYQELLNQSKSQSFAAAPIAHVEESEKKLPTASKADEQAKPEVASNTALDPSELVNHIDKSIPDAAMDNNDALKNDAKAEKTTGPAVPTSLAVEQVNSTEDIDDQIIKLREVSDLVKVNKFENALVLLKELENSKEKQIVVRAKIMLGDLLFNQGEFDLASQVYEEVIKKYAFSGYVLKALGKLVTCSEKLKQPEKQAKYYSLLHDFFEAS